MLSNFGFSKTAQISIAALLVTTPTTALLFRWSRLNKSPDELYSPSELNLWAELLKLAGSTTMVLFMGAKPSPGDGGVKPGLRSPANWVLCFIPSLLYFTQNVMCVVALGFFPASMFIAVANTKILFTAFFSKVLLNASFSFDSVLYLVLLTAGVGVASTAKSACDDVQDADGLEADHMSKFHMGLLLSGLTALCSGLAGAYTQKFLQQTFNNVWEANVVMGFTSAIFSAISVFVLAPPGTSPALKGFFNNWTSVVWAAAFLQAGHGILSAFAIKHTSSVIKSIIGASAIIASSLIDSTVFHDALTLTMVLGEVVIACTAVGYIRAQSLIPQPPSPMRRSKPEPEVAEATIDMVHRVSNSNLDLEMLESDALLKTGNAPFDGRSPRTPRGTPRGGAGYYRGNGGSGGGGSGSGGSSAPGVAAGLLLAGAVVATSVCYSMQGAGAVAVLAGRYRIVAVDSALADAPLQQGEGDHQTRHLHRRRRLAVAAALAGLDLDLK